MTEYQAELKKGYQFRRVTVRPVTSLVEAEFALRRAIFRRYGKIPVTPVHDGRLFLHSKTSDVLGRIVVVVEEDINESASKKLRQWIDQQQCSA